MRTRIEAIYENGALHPVEPLSLAEHERVMITIEPHIDLGGLYDLIDHTYHAQCKAELAKRDKPALTIKEIRELLKNVEGSLSDLIIQQRGGH